MKKYTRKPTKPRKPRKPRKSRKPRKYNHNSKGLRTLKRLRDYMKKHKPVHPTETPTKIPKNKIVPFNQDTPPNAV